ncbi:hypothetical protein [Pseudokineococcus lusitanus]|uniref:Apea-like HEPN domain-containing protein n=1 Tax=Pseudokineococcus lusitanus TaxID=763993 RepID=A0A3N1G9P6_9ACTN|nr:hypothetical protein [Pseudokineococcus lusitanus]ROP26956.1 hypothetical protein EDC03_2884 [Pseudokineococcus lusitanus]
MAEDLERRIVGVLELSWDEEGDLWFGALARSCEDFDAPSDVRVRGTSHSGGVRTLDLLVEGGAVSVLIFSDVLASNETVLVASGDWPEETRRRVAESVAHADALFRSGGTTHDWVAVIGAVDSNRTPMPALGLEGHVGGMRIYSSDVLQERPIMQDVPSMSAWSQSMCVPVIVSGTTKAISEHLAPRMVASDLRALCGMLSLAWGVTIDVIQAPSALNGHRVHVPEVLPWNSATTWTPDGDWRESVERLSVPAWLDREWPKVVGVRAAVRLRNGLSMYMEGRYVERRHPTLASVAYVATIEAVGAALIGVRKSQDLLKADLFKQAITLVLDQRDIDSLQAAYAARSRAVHDARLYGLEVEGGATSHMYGFASGQLPYAYGEMPILALAARRLLLRSFGEDGGAASAWW